VSLLEVLSKHLPERNQTAAKKKKNISQDTRPYSRDLRPKFTEYKKGGDKTSKQKFSVPLENKETQEFTKNKK